MISFVWPRSQKKKMVKISHFQQFVGFLPPQNRILLPRCSPQQISGAATELYFSYFDEECGTKIRS